MSSVTVMPYVISFSSALVFLVLAALISVMIQYEMRINPSDPFKRKLTYWVLCFLNPAATFLLGFYVFKPVLNRMMETQYLQALARATGIGLFLYLLIGFILSRIFKTGKLGHWY